MSGVASGIRLDGLPIKTGAVDIYTAEHIIDHKDIQRVRREV